MTNGKSAVRNSKGRWKKGTSGNSNGRPAGSRNKSTSFFEGLFHNQGESLVEKTIQLAHKGNATALRLCLDRICPPCKDRTIEIPELMASESAGDGFRALVTAVGEGRVTPGEAESLSHLFESQARVADVDDLLRRITDLEKALAAEAAKSSGALTLDEIARRFDQVRSREPLSPTGPENGKGYQTPSEPPGENPQDEIKEGLTPGPSAQTSPPKAPSPIRRPYPWEE